MVRDAFSEYAKELARRQNPSPDYKIRPSANFPDSPTGVVIDGDPVVLQADLRAFWGRTGINAGVDDVIYTVPPGYRYYLEQVFKKRDAYISNLPYAYIIDAAGNEILRFRTNNVQYDLLNQLPQKIKLLPGDIIRGYYISSDAAGACSFSFIGVLELDTGQVRVNT